MVKIKNYTVDYGRIDTATPISGLFQVVAKRPDAHKKTVEITKSIGEMEMEYVSAYILDHLAWKILVAVCGLCGQENQRLSSDNDEQLWDLMTIEGAGKTKEALKWQGSVYRLLMEAGLSNASTDRKRLYDRLKQMSSVRQFLSTGKKRVSGSNLLSYAIDDETGELGIAINPHIARFITGGAEVRYTRVALSETRALSCAAAVLLHGQLSSRVRANTQTAKPFMLDTLISWIYPSSDDPSVLRYRRSVVRKALAEIGQLKGWDITSTRNVINVRRTTK